MKRSLELLRNERIMAYVKIVMGCVLGAMAYPMFMVPNAIASGGVTGIATILNHLFGTPVGFVSILFNIPLFIIGYRSMGKVFAFRSMVATVLFSVLIDILPVGTVTHDPLLGCIFGGVMVGIGLGLILHGGATTGGTDMIARMIHARFQHISVGVILLSIDFFVVVAAGFFIQIEHALYALISIYLASRLIDAVMAGFSRAKACYVISQKPMEVKQELMEQLKRGMTVLNAQGGYSGEERPVLLCLLSAQELGQLKAIVRQVDEKAFVFITDAHEVLGEGFNKLVE